jgi:hypothetical protein
VIGYRVYNPSNELVCPSSPETVTLQVSCIDFLTAPKAPKLSDANLTYSVVALYRGFEKEALSKNVSQGPAGTRALSKTPQAPNEMKVALKAEKTPEGSVILKWEAPVGGAPVAFYRIYRGSKDYTGRYATVAAAKTEFTDTNTETAHEYWVTAVSESMTESPFLGSVTL